MPPCWKHDKEQGGHLGAVSFVDLPGFKFSLVADTALKPGDTLLRVPSSLHISPSYVRQTEFGKLFEALDDSAVLALGLLAEAAKGEKMLPSSEELHIPLLWPEEERRQLLAGSPLDMATEQQLLQLSEQWTDIAAVVKELPELNSESWTKDRTRGSRYLWAHAIVLTRALPFGNELSLIPGLDLANHELGSKNTCSIGVATADGQVVEERRGRVDPRPVHRGGFVPQATDAKQLEENEPEADGGVGLRLAWEMVHTYGFVPNNLPAYAGRPVFFEGVSAEDGMAKQKQALFEALGADPTVLEGFWHELRPALQKPISAENEDRVKNQIVGAVKEALAELPAEKELQDKAQRAAEGPQQIRETLAAKVLLGERLALETCLEHILKAVEAAVVLQADGTALQSAVRQLLLLRPKDLDAPACLALQEQLSLMGVHPEEPGIGVPQRSRSAIFPKIHLRPWPCLARRSAFRRCCWQLPGIGPAPGASGTQDEQHPAFEVQDDVLAPAEVAQPTRRHAAGDDMPIPSSSKESEKVKIADVNGMRGLVATQDIAENESIVEVPLGASIDISDPTTDGFFGVIQKTLRRRELCARRAQESSLQEGSVKWALCTVAQRAFSLVSPIDGLLRLMLPGIDLFNHDAHALHTMKVRWNLDGYVDAVFKVIAGSPIKKGEEVRICYGGSPFRPDGCGGDCVGDLALTNAQYLMRWLVKDESESIRESLAKTTVQEDDELLSSSLPLSAQTALEFRRHLKVALKAQQEADALAAKAEAAKSEEKRFLDPRDTDDPRDDQKRAEAEAKEQAEKEAELKEANAAEARKQLLEALEDGRRMRGGGGMSLTGSGG
eukprot:g6567.t1